MRNELQARGWVPGVKYAFGGYSARPLPVLEPPEYEGQYVTVPGEAFDPPAQQPVKMDRQGRPVYAMRETAQQSSEELAAYYNDQAAKRKDKG